MAEPRRRIVLASQSAARRAMLDQAGIDFLARPASIDETALKRGLLAGRRPVGPAELSTALAEAKALSVSRDMPEAVVVGSDQVLAIGGQLYDKPSSIAEARAQLQSLRGRVHELHASVAMAVDGTVVWRSSDVARLRMRPFSDVFLERYLSAVGGDVCSTVGAYKLEGLGVQLFDRIEGDYFTVLGMPLMPLLAALRDRGVLEN